MAPTQADQLLKRIQLFTGLCVALSFVGGPALGVLTFKVSADYRIKAIEQTLAEHGAVVKALNDERISIARSLTRLESQLSAMSMKLDRLENIIDREKYTNGGK